MGSSRFCPNCGYIFHGQRTGKCPNCDESALIFEGRSYPLDPAVIRRFEEFDKHGGNPIALKFCGRNISLIEMSAKGKWVTLSVLGAAVTFSDYGQGPEIIAVVKNKDGLGVESFPPQTLNQAAVIAALLIAEE